MDKMKIKKLILSVLLCGVLAGCASGEKSTADYTHDGYVSSLRTGVMAQGFSYGSMGTGNIEIHEFNELDLGTSGVSYKDGELEWFEPEVSYG